MSSIGDNNGSKDRKPVSSSQDEGKRIKNLGFSVDPPSNSSSSLSRTEFWYEVLEEKYRRAVGTIESMMGEMAGQAKKELDLSKFPEWKDPMIPQLGELLIKSLSTTYREAIKKIAQRGYSEEVAELAVLRNGPHFGRKDIVSNIMDTALGYLGSGKEFDISKCRMFEDFENLVEYTMLEMTYVLKEVKPSLSIVDAMWCLLIFDLNLPLACAMEGDPLKFFADEIVQGESSSDSTLDQQVNSEPQKSGTHKLSSQLLCELQKNEEESWVPVQITRPRSVQEVLMEGSGKKVHLHNPKRDFLRKKTFQFAKSYKRQTSKGAFRTKLTSLGPLVLDNKPKPQSNGVSIKKSSMPPEANPKTPPMPIPQEKAKSTEKAQIKTLPPPKTAEYYCAGIPYDESQGKYVAQDEKDEIILALVARMQALQEKSQSWGDWANQKVMQVARRLSLDQVELKRLRLEKEETEKFINEKQFLEENTAKSLCEMEHALDSSIHRLEAESSALNFFLEEAKKKELQETAKLEKAMLREEEALKKCQSIEPEKAFLQGKLTELNCKTGALQQGMEKSKAVIKQFEVLRAHEEKEKMKILKQAENIRNEKERKEDMAKVEEERIEEEAKKELQKRKDEMSKMEEMVSELKLGGTLKEEHECVMCLAEEKSVVFLPCAHQVLCVDCNVIHEKKGMKDCPSCRTPIQKRVSVRFAR